MQIELNGKPHDLPAHASVAQLIAALGLTGRRLAVERNGEVVPRSSHGETKLADGDRVEIVHAVGGG
ncbi:MAG TPA: sulfur carrier protein ThiS [Burkholderiaceae bacterium]|nr:sulfur carrier protein ThiS [Burkholderiaceae bacterium]